MVCIGTATHRHRTEVRTPGRLDARWDYSALAATLIEQNDSEPLAAARCWCAGWVCLGRQIRGAAGRSNRRRQRRDNRQDRAVPRKVFENNRLC